MSLKSLIRNFITNKKIKRYKYVHIMYNDKFTQPFIDILNRNFDPTQHLILCQKFQDLDFPIPDYKNVITITRLKHLNLTHADKIICHSLFGTGIIDYFYANQNLLRTKTYWMIYGGDLYNAARDTKNDFVRRNFRGYISDTDGDCDVVRAKYNIQSAEFFNAGYAFPITSQMITDAKSTQRYTDATTIQINNSADHSTLEMLDILARFNSQNIKIKTILSYGQTEYKPEIIARGTELFGDKFEYLDKILTPAEYAKYISENDILILNQNRQQGLGNCFAALNFGTKVFIKSEITTFHHLTNKGCTIFDTNKISDMTFEQLCDNPSATKSANILNSTKFFTDEYLVNLWKPIFE